MIATVEIREADSAELETWDEFVRRSVNGTLFHERAFLAYHGDRFSESERFLVGLDRGRVSAALALAVSEEEDGPAARSPYGASYGGIVFAEPPTYERSRQLVDALLAYLAEVGVTRLAITPPHALCTSVPLDTFHFALLEAGFVSVNRDVVSAAVLDDSARTQSERARRSVRKAEEAGVTVEFEAPVDDFWRTVDATFLKHQSAPTHTFAEFRDLVDRLPGRVQPAVAYADGVPVAGLGEFELNERVQSSFYICQDPDRQDLQALSLLVAEALERASVRGFAAYDFGTSTANMQARPGVWAFKENFTRVGVFRETFEWSARER